MTDPRIFNAKVIEEFRANAGRVGGDLADTTLVLLHHIGARSGIERVTPVAASLRQHGRFVIVASNGGSLTHPARYYNLKANPRIRVELGTQMLTAVAEELEGRARAEVWPMLVAEAPRIGELQSPRRTASRPRERRRTSSPAWSAGRRSFPPTVELGRGASNVCPEGTDVTVRTVNTSGQLTDGAFSFVLN